MTNSNKPDFQDVPAWREHGVWRIAVAPKWDCAELLELLCATTERSDAVLLQQGRERVVKVACEVAGVSRDVVVKTYRAPGKVREFFEAAEKGSKAFRAFKAAWILMQNGVGTPEVIAVAERREGGHLLESRLITLFVNNMTDFRTEMNRLLIGKNIEDPATAISELMQTVAKACRAFHDCGIIHRDLGNQNIGLLKEERGGWKVFLLDLDRVRIFEMGTLSWNQRGRDLARIFLPSELRWFFSHMYCGKHPCPLAFNRGLHAGLRAWRFHCKTRILRHPILEFSRRFLKKGRAAETPLEGVGVWVWDEKTGQAIIVHDKKTSRQFRPLYNFFASLKEFLLRGSAIRAHYRAFRAQSFEGSVDFSGTLGMTLDVNPETWEKQLLWLGELEEAACAKLPILLRFCHHKGREHWELVAEKAVELHRRGNAVAFAFVQSRDAIRNPASWRDMVLFAVEKTQGFADFYEVGHATNRSKWGIWDFRDYGKLLDPAIEAKEQYPHIKLTGPACIDFDLHNLPGILSVVPPRTFHLLSHHLYVDRRGAPENFQGKFDLVGKCAIHRALAKTYGFAEEKIVISEVNWPLSGVETYSPCAAFFCDPGSPTKSPPNVSEVDYAKYMCRYWLLAIASGHVTRIYWWRLVHRGFGLIDDSNPEKWRAMPAFLALKDLLRQLVGAHFEKQFYDVAAGTWSLEFSRCGGTRFRIQWNKDSVPFLVEI